MNELCIERCVIQRDCSGFDPKPNLKLDDMPRFPLKASVNMTREEKFTVVTIYLAIVVDHLKGVDNGNYTYPIPRPNTDRTRSSPLPENLKVEDLLSGIAQADTSYSSGPECQDQKVGSDGLAEPEC